MLERIVRRRAVLSLGSGLLVMMCLYVGGKSLPNALGIAGIFVFASSLLFALVRMWVDVRDEMRRSDLRFVERLIRYADAHDAHQTPMIRDVSLELVIAYWDKGIGFAPEYLQRLSNASTIRLAELADKRPTTKKLPWRDQLQRQRSLCEDVSPKAVRRSEMN